MKKTSGFSEVSARGAELKVDPELVFLWFQQFSILPLSTMWLGSANVQCNAAPVDVVLALTINCAEKRESIRNSKGIVAKRERSQRTNSRYQMNVRT